jgi:hypothetical protein
MPPWFAPVWEQFSQDAGRRVCLFVGRAGQAAGISKQRRGHPIGTASAVSMAGHRLSARPVAARSVVARSVARAGNTVQAGNTRTLLGVLAGQSRPSRTTDSWAQSDIALANADYGRLFPDG